MPAKRNPTDDRGVDKVAVEAIRHLTSLGHTQIEIAEALRTTRQRVARVQAYYSHVWKMEGQK